VNRYIKNSIDIENIDKLPSYPIPSLKDTLEKYLEWVAPLTGDVELQTAKESVNDFLAAEDSDKLEQKLIELGSRPNDSWIFDYWVKSHLEVRAPLSPHTNVPIIYENESIAAYSQLQQISILCHAISKVYLDFRQQGPKKYRLNKKEYSSDQMTGLFAAINHIKAGIDEYYINPDISDFIVFNYKNNLFKVKTIENENVISASRVYEALSKIVNSTSVTAMPNANYVTVGVDRNKAGKILSEILENGNNEKSYAHIKDSIFVFNLDDIDSNSMVENLNNATYDSNAVNRWHGKALQFSCSKNGVFSFIADHCFVDGGTELLMINKVKDIIDSSIFDFAEDEVPCEYDEIQFQITDAISQELMEMKTEFDACMQSFKTRVVNFERLNRTILKENGVLSGDGFIHMAFQAAQYMTYGDVFNTYISVDARTYFRGRTECNRPVSKESISLSKAITEGTMSRKEFDVLLHAALNEHHRRTKICQSGVGVNRYLYVLEEVYKEFRDELAIECQPSLFKTEAYKIIGNNRLSTTSFTHENMKYLYFPPVVENGLGIYYLVNDESFAIITAFNDFEDDLERFISNLEYSISYMLKMLVDGC